MFTRHGRSPFDLHETTLWFTHNALTKLWRSHNSLLLTSGQEHYQTRGTIARRQIHLQMPVVLLIILIHANPFPDCVLLAFSGCTSASVTSQAVTLDCAVKVLW
ncbi:MAG: hypothetical protein AB3A66_28495 (plasmid) [Nodularia sp. CChRGM 3473]